jgi:hypothetical protein
MIPLPFQCPDDDGRPGPAGALCVPVEPFPQTGRRPEGHGHVIRTVVVPPRCGHSGTRAVGAGVAGGMHDVTGGYSGLVLAHRDREPDRAVAVVPPLVGVDDVAAGAVCRPCDLLHVTSVLAGNTSVKRVS